MISVLHIITGLETGGAENSLIQLAARLDRRAFAPSVISLTTPGPRARELVDAGVPVAAMGMAPGRPPTVRSISRLFQAIRRTRPTILQTWLPHADLLGQLVGMAAGAQTICWNIRSAELAAPDHPRSLFWVVRALSWLSTRPACIITNSLAGKRAHEAIGYHPGRWETIPNGFDLVRFAPSGERRAEFRRRLAVSADVPLVGLVARYHPMKDHRTFVEAAALVSRTKPDARFVIVGRGVAPGNRELQNQMAAHKLETVMYLEGESPDTAAVFPGLDVAVSSSYSESFPNVVGEAMACGVPCVVTDAGDSKAVVGATGVVVPVRDPAALADGIRQVLALDGSSRVRLGQLARARVEAEYSLDVMVSRYERLYKELADRATAGHDTVCAE